MCAIFGIISKDRIDFDPIINMSSALKHRGPDDEGYLLFNNEKEILMSGTSTRSTSIEMHNIRSNIHTSTETELDCSIIGHRRLAIQDLSENGFQPMKYLDRYWIVFNGEIYNFLELRDELKLHGYQFKSNSDTEVILAAYDKWGVECLKKFNGMWAFLIYDNNLKLYFFSRDRFGVKPLYLSLVKNKLIFASELKAIVATSIIANDANTDYIEEFLKFGPDESGEKTAFKDVLRLKPSHYILSDLDGLLDNRFIQEKYWSIVPNLSTEKFNKYKAKSYALEYYNILEDAVRIRLRSDVKVGAALSGGLDSSSIVYLINKIQNENGVESKQETFSCVWTKNNVKHYDESEYIDKLVCCLKIKCNKVEPYWNEVPETIDQVAWYMDSPFPNTAMSGWHTYKLIQKNKIKVTLEGQGADEQLSGYLGYVYIYLISLSFPQLIKESVQFLRVPGAFKHVLAGVIFNILIKSGFYFIANILYRKLTKSRRDLDVNLNERLASDSLSGLVNLLHYGDRISMAHSIESRMPFLDYRLAEYLASVPCCYKMHNGWTKYIARLAFDNLLPDEICWRKDKMGWPIPELEWLKGPLYKWYIESIEESRFTVHYAKKLNFNYRKIKLPQSLYYLNLSKWCNKFKVNN